MPPASLSTFDVISPGPNTAPKSARRRHKWRLRRRTWVARRCNSSVRALREVQFICRSASLVSASRQRRVSIVPACLHNDARSRVITSSTVIAPIGRPETSTTATLRRLYLSNSAKTSFSRAPGVTVDHENRVQLLNLNLPVAYPIHHFGARRRFAHVNEIGGHHSARRVLIEAQQRFHLAGFFSRQFLDYVLRDFRREISQNVGSHVWLHLLDDVRRFSRRHFLHDLRSQPRIQFR